MTEEEETAHIAEIARISLIRIEITERIVMTQIAMLLRDLGIKGEATTIIGKVELVGGTLVLVHPNEQMQKMTDKRCLVSRLVNELSSYPYNSRSRS
jgi:hypothetical protein